ncbi:MAG: DUF7577 domain-containing protein [Ardenticatenaceae bacterium]
MSALRICPHCGTANDKQATFCGACATQIVTRSTALVRVPKKNTLPVLSQRDKATLGGVALGIAAMAVRVGINLLKHAADSKQAKELLPATQSTLPARVTQPGSPSLLIRRRWVVSDGTNPPRWGEEEIEVHRQDNDPNSYRISLK